MGRMLMLKVPLQTLLRDGIRAEELSARAHHFVESAQVADGQRAPSAWRDNLKACLDAFVTAMDSGIESEGDPARTVMLFRTWRYRVDTSRTAYTLEHLPSGETLDTFEVGSPMRTFRWAASMGVSGGVQLTDWSQRQWIEDRLTRFARRHIDGIALRRQLSAILAPCSVALLRARRAAAAHPSRSDCPAAWLDVCTQNAEILDEVQRIAPGVLPLVGRQHISVAKALHRGILRDVRAAALSAGATPADWARAIDSNARPLWAAIAKGYVVPWIDPEEFFAAWCRMHRDLPSDIRLTRSMWLTALRPNGEGVADALTLPTYWKVSPHFVRSAIAASAAAHLQGQGETFLNNWARVIRWLADFMQRGVGRPPTTFASALRRAERDERRTRAAALEKACMFPEFPLSDWTHGDWAATDLASPSALVEQAIQQAHCGEMLVEACARGELRVFSVAQAETGEPIGTVSLDRHKDGWRPSNAKHFANRPPSPKLVDFLFRLASAVEKAEGRIFNVTTAQRRAFVIRTIH
jgi:hypothetical protein